MSIFYQTAVSGIPVGIAVARQRQEPRPQEDPQPGSIPPRVADPGNSALPTHWSLPPTPCTPGLPPAPYWLPQSQFSGNAHDTIFHIALYLLHEGKRML